MNCRDVIFEVFFRPEKPVAALILAGMKMRLFAQVRRQNRHFVAAEIAARTFYRRRFFVNDVDIGLAKFQNCFLVSFASPMFVLFPLCFEAQVANVARKRLRIKINNWRQLTFARKVTNKLFTQISAIKNGWMKLKTSKKKLEIFEAKLHYAFLASLRSAIWKKFKWTTDFPLYHARVNIFLMVRRF